MGPWRVTLNQEVYGPFMEYCEHRVLRENLWKAQRNRASMALDNKDISNHMIIAEIRNFR